MAGNIIPAIATTNAIVAGLVVMKALAVLKDKAVLSQSYVRASTNWPIKDGPPEPANQACPVCTDVYIPFKADLKKLTLGQFIKEVVQGWLKPSVAGDDDYECMILEGGRVLADPDFDDNYDKTLAELGVKRGQYLTVADEDGMYRRVQFCVAALVAGAEKVYTLPEEVPEVPMVPPPRRATSEASEGAIAAIPSISEAVESKKRSAPDDEPGPAKKVKLGKGTEDAIEIE